MSYLEYMMKCAGMSEGNNLALLMDNTLHSTMPKTASRSLKKLMKTAFVDEGSRSAMYNMGRDCALSKYAGNGFTNSVAWLGNTVKSMAAAPWQGLVSAGKNVRNAIFSMRHGGMARTEENIAKLHDEAVRKAEREAGEKMANRQMMFDDAQNARAEMTKRIGYGAAGIGGGGGLIGLGVALHPSSPQQPMMYPAPAPAPAPAPMPMQPQQQQ